MPAENVPIMVFDGVATLPPAANGAVVVGGSNAAIPAAYVSAKAGVRAAIHHDCGIGRDEAGVSGLLWAEQHGMAMAAVASDSARVGDGADMLQRGIVSRVNGLAAMCGVDNGHTVVQAVVLLKSAPWPHAAAEAPVERRTVIEGILCMDSVSFGKPEDAGLVVATGSHGGATAAPMARSFRPGAGRDAWRERRAAQTDVVLYGWHTVTAALANPQRHIRRLLATENALRRLAEENIALKVTPEVVRPGALDARLTPDAVHQGLLAEADPLPSPSIEDMDPSGIVLVLDQITDPHNVGAILRTAAAFAVAAIVTTARHSPDATGVLAKSASGALELVPIVIVQNLARALAGLKERGFLTVGLDSSAPDDLAATELRAPLALVLGAEGKGLRQLTGETCDRLARLDLPGAIKSLNVSNAAALALYIASRATS